MRYVYVTQELRQTYDSVTGEAIPLEWQDIDELTRDPNLQATKPGRYAVSRRTNTTYVLPTTRP